MRSKPLSIAIGSIISVVALGVIVRFATLDKSDNTADSSLNSSTQITLTQDSTTLTTIDTTDGIVQKAPTPKKDESGGKSSKGKTTTTKKSAAPSSVSAKEKEIVTLVNQVRRSKGLEELKLHVKLCSVARTKSQDMSDKGYFSHTSPTYGSPFDMISRFDISYRTAGENIAQGYTSPKAVMDGWMNSEGHRANILNPDFTQIGVGYVTDGNYWTQMFIG